MKFKLFLIAAFLISALNSCHTKSQNNTGQYLEEKKNFQTKLIKKEKAPQEYEDLETTNEAIKIEYPSNNLKLQGLILKKNIDSTKKKPVLVFLHGGFALGEQDLLDCDVFTKQGYIVFAPSYRAENGNGGFFELFLGEVDDAKAAIQWIAKQPYADSSKIYVFGHSIGGGISSLLSLEKDVPIAKSGSSGGLYDKDFYGWDDIIPYDRQNPGEGKMRVLMENLNSMQINHYAFVGMGDEALYMRKAELDAKANNTKLKIFYIKGDHFSSLEPAMEKFIDVINSK